MHAEGTRLLEKHSIAPSAARLCYIALFKRREDLWYARISLGTAELQKEFFGFARAFLTQQNGFGLALWIADQAFFVQMIQRIPVVTFPRVNRSTL